LVLPLVAQPSARLDADDLVTPPLAITGFIPSKNDSREFFPMLQMLNR
jgi:hypothetical protein